MFDKSITVTADTNGRAVAAVAPNGAWTKWTISRMVIFSNSILLSECTVYQNVETPGRKVDHSYSGNSDASETDLEILPGDNLLFVWSGCTIGALCTAHVTGLENGSSHKPIHAGYKKHKKALQ